MLLSWTHVIGGFLLLFAYKWYSIWRQMRNLPPGPFSLPFIGSLCVYFNKGKLLYPQFINQLTKQYGDIMTIWIGSKPLVILSSLDNVRAAFVDNQHDFASRPDSISFDIFDRGLGGVFAEKYNTRWKAHKKLTARAIRSIVDTALVERSVESGLTEALEELTAKANNNTPVNLAAYISNVVYNVITNFCFGDSYKMDDPQFWRFINLSLELNRYWDESQYIDRLPFIRYLPMFMIKQFPGVKQLTPVLDEYYDVITAKIKKHPAKQNGEVNDILDAFYEQKALLKEEGEIVKTESFVPLIGEIFSAGTDTTSYSLLWYFLFLTKNPIVQEKCYQQIKEVVGSEIPKLKHRQLMPYVEASLLESLRKRPFVPLNMAHCSDSDKQLLGYTIPSCADININTLALHNDPEVYANPNVFDPNNFLNPDGSVFRPQSFFTFGAGRRACLGENLAKNDLFLIATSFLQKFQFLPVPGVNYSDEQSDLAELFALPQSYEVLIKLRE